MKKKKPSHPENLEWYMKNYKKMCKRCFHLVVIHSYKSRTTKKKVRSVSGACWNDNCTEYGVDVIYPL